MFEDFTKRDLIIGAILAIVGAVVTIEGTYYVLHAYVLDRPDPIYKQGGLKPGQDIK